MNGELLIELRDVGVPARWDTTLVPLADVNWTVRAGEFWIVAGEQGSGKSDLMFLLAGLRQPTGGTFTVFGYDLAQKPGEDFSAVRQRVGVVFDDARLFNHLTIAENVALPARYHHDLHEDEATTWVSALLQATGLTEFAANSPGALARPWRRRAALARALALKPKVLILENPLRGLDARHAAWWVEFLTNLSRGHNLLRGEAVTVVLSADEFRPWRGVTGKFALANAGKFIVTGDTAPEDEWHLPPATVEEGT